MIEELQKLARTLTGGHWWWGVAVSLVLFAGSMALVTVIVIGWPVDHFRRGSGGRSGPTATRRCASQG